MSTLRAECLTVLLVAGVLPACGPELEEAEVNPSLSQAQALVMPPCGSVLASWQGTQAYSNGPDTGTGRSCDGTGSDGYRYQCVELVMRHFKKNWGLRWYGNAKDLLANAPGAFVQVRANGNAALPPVTGDMVVWPNGAYGHVALVVAVRADAIDVIEQNVSGNGRATLPFADGSIAARWGSWVPAGWAHAIANTASSEADAGTPPPDAGAQQTDAGAQPPDAGAQDLDAGTLPVPEEREQQVEPQPTRSHRDQTPGEAFGGCSAAGSGWPSLFGLIALTCLLRRRSIARDHTAAGLVSGVRSHTARKTP